VIGSPIGAAASTVHAVLRRHGRSRLAPKARPEQTIGDERERPGELVHVEIKKLGRIAIHFLNELVRLYASHAIPAERA